MIRKNMVFIVVEGDKRQEELYSMIKQDGFEARLTSAEEAEKISGERTVILAAPNMEMNNVHTLRYAQREEFAIKNAVITAEKALQVAMDNLATTVSGSNVLVMGNGKIGKALAFMLRGIGAEAYVSTRRPEDREMVRLAGHRALNTDELEGQLYRFDVIFNTIPFMVLGEQRLCEVKKSALIIDLASQPGGVDFDAAERLNIKCVHALALPGRLAPTSAARAIWDTVQSMLREESYERT